NPPPRHPDPAAGGPHAQPVFNALREGACGGPGGCQGGSGAANRVIDGQDYANRVAGGAFHPNAQPNCPSRPVPEAFHPYTTGGAPTYKYASQAFNAAYPD